MKLHSTTILFCLVPLTDSFAPASLHVKTDISLSRRQDDADTTSSTQLYATKAEKRRVVVTGLGVISGCGIGADDFFQACVDGQSSLRKVQRFDASAYPCQIASEVPAEMFDANDHFTNPKNARSNDRYTHFAVAAARQALKDAGLGDTPETLQNPERVGVMVGSAFGGMETFEQETLKLAAKPDRPKVSDKISYVSTVAKSRANAGCMRDFCC